MRNLEICKKYYFDSALVSYGELVEINDDGYLFFKPIKNTIYDVENGLVEFRTNMFFKPYTESINHLK